MQTTLNKIREYHPCKSGWKKLLAHLEKTQADDDPIDFIVIREAVGIEDTIWCLRTQDFHDYCLFLADVAESVLPIFENSRPKDDRPRKAIAAIHAWHRGEITKVELSAAAVVAAAATAATAYAAAAAADAAYAAAAAATAYASASAAAATADAAYAADARSNKWAEIDALFVQYFGTKQENTDAKR